jgi:hypothetical protein
MPPLESQLLRSVSLRLKRLARDDPSLQWRKRFGSVMGVTGDADVYGCWRSIHFEMELKRPGFEPTLLQCTRLAAWKRAGALTFIVHSLAEFDAAIEHLRKVVV